MLQRVDQLVALLDDLVLGLEDILSLTALAALELPDPLLNLVLLSQRDRLPCLPPSGL